MYGLATIASMELNCVPVQMNLNLLPSRAEMEQAACSKDASYDGVFFVAVRTTGIFCRPSCPARLVFPIQSLGWFAAVCSPAAHLIGEACQLTRSARVGLVIFPSSQILCRSSSTSRHVGLPELCAHPTAERTFIESGKVVDLRHY